MKQIDEILRRIKADEATDADLTATVFVFFFSNRFLTGCVFFIIRVIFLRPSSQFTDGFLRRIG